MSKQLLLLALVTLLGSVGLTYVDQVTTRVHDLERETAQGPARVARLATQLEEVRQELEASHRRLARYEQDRAVAARLGSRIERIESEFACTQDQLEEEVQALGIQTTELLGLDERREQLLSQTFGERWDHISQDIDARWEDVHRTLEATAKLAVDSQQTVQTLARSVEQQALIEAEYATQWSELMGPTVQLTDDSTVGSGVLLRSEPLPDGSGWRTYLLTAWHVVRDILDDPKILDQPVPVHIYRESGGYTPEEARLVVYDASIDAALLVMTSTRRFENGARLASRERLEVVRTFDDIYAVGCPLGNDPIPTRGEVADVHHRVDEEHYWMISAPTYIGNSGGGIYDAHTHELLGIFSKIYTHGNLRPTVIPHMGLVTPLSVVYDWLDEVGYEHLVQD
jgi:hypothetical protein